MSDIYRVGRANDPQPEDPTYVREADAIERAQRMADAYGFNAPIGVWDRFGEPVWLFMLGEQFRRV